MTIEKAVKITNEHIQAWKEKYKDVFKLTAADGKVGYCRKPNRDEVSYAMTLISGDPLAYHETILKATWLGGDEAIVEDKSYLYGLGAQLDKLLDAKKVEVEKL
ncbi:hypothetical protein HGH92_21610 [Chitinophaga varians]|uniref:Uncharacterized protein n=1 Tax=Chitinophaga varians TaxID=2202339 RepID=A0A847RM93_9BACT|nr:hypothetical protein [Chitinophaga varians]MBC9915018.1 hypothetical protein [Chitinophaga varians]NLR66920.1 hypothetical protein [Chitinophaga varians]